MKDLDFYKKLEYPFRVDPDPEGGFVASIPDLPGCYSFGETKQEAIEKLDESKDVWLESYYEMHGEAPEPGKEIEFSGRFLLRMPKYLHKKLHEAAKLEGVSLNQYVVYLLTDRSSHAEIVRSIRTQMVRSWLPLQCYFRLRTATTWETAKADRWSLSILPSRESKRAATSELFLHLFNPIISKWAGDEEETKLWQR